MRANAPRPREFGANLEHVIQLLQDASTPVIVLVEQAAGMRARNLDAAEQSQEFVDWFVDWFVDRHNGRLYDHGSPWSLVASMTTDVVRLA